MQQAFRNVLRRSGVWTTETKDFNFVKIGASSLRTQILSLKISYACYICHVVEVSINCDCELDGLSVCSACFLEFDFLHGFFCEQFIELIGEHPKLLLLKPSITCRGENLYMQAPPVLEEMTRSNLQKPLYDLMHKLPYGIIHANGTASVNGTTQTCLKKVRISFKVIDDGVTDMDTAGGA